MVLMVCSVALFGMANSYFEWGTVGLLPKVAYEGWLTATFVNRNTAASFFSIGLVIAATLVILEYRAIRERLPRPSPMALLFAGLDSYVPIRLGLAGLIFIALLLTGSRAGVTCSLVSLFAIIFLTPSNGRRARGFLPIILLVGMALTAVAANALLERAHGAPESSAVRISLYKEALAAIYDRPLLGHGGGTYQSVEPLYHRPETPPDLIWSQAHSSYLEAAASLGLPVTATWLALAIWLLIRLVRAARGAVSPLPATIAATAAVIGEGLHAFVDFGLETQSVALYLAALVGLGIGEIMADQNRRRVSGVTLSKSSTSFQERGEKTLSEQ